jgi:protein CpxP
MLKKLTLATALLAGLACSTAVLAQGRHGDFGGGPAAELDRLNLSDAQWLQVRKIMQSRRSGDHPLHQERMELHRALAVLNPGSADYQQQVAKLQDQAAQVARDRVQEMADLKSQVYAVLTEPQRAKLAEDEQALGKHHHESPPQG